MTNLIVVTTYMKIKALNVFIESLIKNKYNEESALLVADDNKGEAEELVTSFKKYFSKLIYTTGSRKGIACNKNRGIKYFVENKEFSSVLMHDDDIEYTNPGLLQHMKDAAKFSKYNHISTYLGEFSCSIDPKQQGGFLQAFPVQAEDEYLYWCKGVQGICLYFTREIINKIGYLRKFPYFYGYEHADYSTRANRVEGYAPEWFAVLKRSPKFLKTQQIPNNYDVDQKQVHEVNSPLYYKRLAKTIAGEELFNSEHSLTGKDEIVIVK